MDSDLPSSLRLKLRCTTDLLSPILYTFVVDVTKLERGVLRKMVYVDDLFLMSETIEKHRNSSENGKRRL